MPDPLGFLIVLGCCFVVGLLLGQRFSHHQVRRSERRLAEVRRAHHDLLREIHAHRDRWR